MRILTKKTKIVVATAAVGTLALSGVAYAYWTTTGSGNGVATTSSGSAAQLRVNQTSAPTANQLAPGQLGSALAGDVTNLTASPSGVSYALKAVSISLTVTPVSGTCDASNYLIVSPNQVAAYSVDGSGVGHVTTKIAADGSAVELTAGQTGAAWTSTLSFVNKATNQDDCKGAGLALAYATVQS